MQVDRLIKLYEGGDKYGNLHGRKWRGRDYIRVSGYDPAEHTFHLEIGHCCVVTFSGIIPVEFLTSLLSRIMVENSYDLKRVGEEYLGYTDEYFNDGLVNALSFSAQLKALKSLVYKTLGKY